MQIRSTQMAFKVGEIRHNPPALPVILDYLRNDTKSDVKKKKLKTKQRKSFSSCYLHRESWLRSNNLRFLEEKKF